jgi:CDGSH-type Zn-finger protein
MPTTIKVRQNGSYLVEGDDVKLIDWNGNEYKPANPNKFALCRCGHSQKKPFCDSTHKTTGFQAEEAAPCLELEARPAEAATPPAPGEAAGREAVASPEPPRGGGEQP